MEDHGYKSLGKYNSARDDALHYMVTSDWANGSFGSMEYGGYYWRISNTPEDVSTENTEVSSLFEEWFELNPEVEDSPEFRAELVGDFIVLQLDSGAVFVKSYPSAEDQEQEWNLLKKGYDNWVESDEDN